MKLLVSDYDLTLNTFDYDVYFNMNAINKFRKKGNIFFLNTGRSFESIKKEVKKYRINYDYLGCCDGNLILNKNNDIIYCQSLSNKIFNELNNLHENYKDFSINIIKYENNILEYEIESFNNGLMFEKEIEVIANKYNLVVKKFKVMGRNIYYLCDYLISKSSATSLVSELENIKSCDIFTIGDNHNDFEMIRDFNGYTLPWGKKEVKEVSKERVLSVASLVKKISR